jgi:pimeloyl-ACP methyl ester carboxylesterase
MLLNYECAGTGEPLVILHGLFGSLDNWQTVRQRLSAHYRVCVVDQRNHGKSPHSDTMDYPSMAEDLPGVLVAENITRAHFLGHSMGGKTAMQLALSHPDHVRSLIVVDIAPRQYAPSHLQILAGLKSLDLNSIKSRSEAEEALAPFVPDPEVRRFLLKNLRRMDHGSFTWRNNLEGISNSYPRLNAAIEPSGKFSGPSLFIRGSLSDYVSDADVPLIHKLFPAAKIETMPKAGHWLHAEAPDEFLRVVSEFLARVK